MKRMFTRGLAILGLVVVLLARGRGNGTTTGDGSDTTTTTPDPRTTGGNTTVSGILSYAGSEFQRGRVAESQTDNTSPNERRAIENDEKWSNRPPQYQPNYGALDEHGRATGISITMNNDVRNEMKHATNPTGRDGVPPGYDSSNQHKGHLLGAQFGGSNTDARNFVPLYEDVNTPTMRGIENQVRRHMSANPNDDFTYTVTPNYNDNPPGNPVPESVTMTLNDSQGNPVQLRDPDGNMVDQVTLPNVP